MDLRAQLGRIVIFTRVVQKASFAAAARELGLSPSLVSAAVSELEAELGVRLLERTTRKLRLTQHGEMLFSRSENLLADLESSIIDVKTSSGHAAGVLRVTCTSVLVQHYVAPVLADLARRDRILSEIVVDDQRRDLVAEGFDAGVRIGLPVERDFVSRSLGSMADVVVAAKHVAERIDPHDFEQVQALPWVAHSALPITFRLRETGGRERSLRIVPAVICNTADAQRALVLAGAGATVAVRTLVEEDLRSGALVRLLPGLEMPALQIFILLPSTQHLPMRTRLFVDALAARAASVG